MAWSAVSTPVTNTGISVSAFGALVAGNFAVIGGARSTWSPTLGNITNHNGTTVARYRQVDKETEFYFQLTFGSTTAVAGGVSITLPTTPSQSGWGCVALALDSSAGSVIYGGVGVNTGSTTLGFRFPPTTAGNSWVGMTATQPFSWAVGDTLTVSGRYENT